MNAITHIPAFFPATPESFRKRCPHFAFVLALEEGRLAAVVNSEAAYRLMAAESLEGRTAFGGIAPLLATLQVEMGQRRAMDEGGPEVAGRLRQAIGSWICEVMRTNGFCRTGRKGRIASARRHVVKAEIYEPELSVS